MTTMSLPFLLKNVDSDTTVLSVDANGATYIGGNLSVSGAQTFTGSMNVAGSLLVSGDVGVSGQANFTNLQILAATAYSTAQVSAFSTAAAGGFGAGGLRLYEVKIIANGTTISLIGINPRFTF